MERRKLTTSARKELLSKAFSRGELKFNSLLNSMENSSEEEQERQSPILKESNKSLTYYHKRVSSKDLNQTSVSPICDKQRRQSLRNARSRSYITEFQESDLIVKTQQTSILLNFFQRVNQYLQNSKRLPSQMVFEMSDISLTFLQFKQQNTSIPSNMFQLIEQTLKDLLNTLGSETRQGSYELKLSVQAVNDMLTATSATQIGIIQANYDQSLRFSNLEQSLKQIICKVQVRNLIALKNTRLPCQNTQKVLLALLTFMSEVDQDIDVTPSCRVMASRGWNSAMQYLGNPGRVIQHIRKSNDYVKQGKISINTMHRTREIIKGIKISQLSNSAGGVIKDLFKLLNKLSVYYSKLHTSEQPRYTQRSLSRSRLSRVNLDRSQSKSQLRQRENSENSKPCTPNITNKAKDSKKIDFNRQNMRRSSSQCLRQNERNYNGINFSLVNQIIEYDQHEAVKAMDSIQEEQPVQCRTQNQQSISIKDCRPQLETAKCEQVDIVTPSHLTDRLDSETDQSSVSTPKNQKIKYYIQNSAQSISSLQEFEIIEKSLIVDRLDLSEIKCDRNY